MRTSGITFQAVSSANFAVSHSERTELAERKIGYLLPEEHRLENIIVDGSLPEKEIAVLFEEKKAGLSRQAKTAGASPFWEGVAVLPEIDGKDYGARQAESLKNWKTAFEKQTGMHVLHMSIHLDEGVMIEGKPVYNPHAHIIIDRTNDKNKIIETDRSQLSKIQTLTAKELGMKRGETIADRKGRPARKHIGHAEYRAGAGRREIELGKERDQARLKMAAEKQSSAAKQVDDVGLYRELRGWLKGSGQAQQSDYMQLKQLQESEQGKNELRVLGGIMDDGGNVLDALREREARARAEREAAADREPMTEGQKANFMMTMGFVPHNVRTQGDVKVFYQTEQEMRARNAKISEAVFAKNDENIHKDKERAKAEAEAKELAAQQERQHRAGEHARELEHYRREAASTTGEDVIVAANKARLARAEELAREGKHLPDHRKELQELHAAKVADGIKAREQREAATPAKGFGWFKPRKKNMDKDGPSLG